MMPTLDWLFLIFKPILCIPKAILIMEMIELEKGSLNTTQS